MGGAFPTEPVPSPPRHCGWFVETGEQGGILLAGSSGQWDGRGVAFLSPSSPPPGELSQEYRLLKFRVSFVYQQANNRETLVSLKYNAIRLPLKEAPASPRLRKQLTWPLQLSLCPRTGAVAWAMGHREGCLAWPTSPVNRRGWGGAVARPLLPLHPQPLPTARGTHSPKSLLLSSLSGRKLSLSCR